MTNKEKLDLLVDKFNTFIDAAKNLRSIDIRVVSGGHNVSTPQGGFGEFTELGDDDGEVLPF